MRYLTGERSGWEGTHYGAPVSLRDDRNQLKPVSASGEVVPASHRIRSKMQTLASRRRGALAFTK